ncbi:MAG TPA: hypothetical protein DCG57_08655 [Candidatus Riflebacteria bacterium]|nr:hypothetical protein [Candidatus Riflebacteria bacterium]
MNVKIRKLAVLLMTAALFLCGCALSAQVSVSGRASARLSEKLNVGDAFSVAAGESLVLKFQRGETVNLIESSNGKIASEGVNLTQGSCFVRYKKLSNRFIVKTPLAAFAGTDCQFFLQNSSDRVKAVIVAGELRVLTRDRKNMQAGAGETLTISADISELRKSVLDDTSFWKNDPGMVFNRSKLPDKLPKRFGEIYIYSMAVLEKGGGKVVFADPARAPQSASDKDLVVLAGSKIITGASETAALRLGENTLIRIAPDSEILLKSSHFEVIKGTCLVRHGTVLFPVKVGGPSPMLITRDSSVELVSVDKAIVATVYKGNLQLPGTGEHLAAGFSFRISDKGAEKLEMSNLRTSPLFVGFSSRHAWTPDVQIFSDNFDESDPFYLSDETPDKPGMQNRPSPGSILQQYDIRPEGGR